jgi:hypothetical protein
VVRGFFRDILFSVKGGALWALCYSLIAFFKVGVAAELTYNKMTVIRDKFFAVTRYSI